MPQQLALALCLGFIGWLFWRERKTRADDATVSWIPAIWFASITSRPLSYWLGIGGSEDNLDGNPFEAMFQLAIFATAFCILLRRQLNWTWFVHGNKLFVLFFGYFVLSAFWSEFPVPSLKRITKELGQILVLLVLFTEKDPVAALKTTFRRCAFFLLPLSILLIKYYGDVGRTYSRYAGEVMYVGVTSQKNSLGALSALCGLGMIWEIVDRRRDELRQSTWWEMRHLIITLLMAVYLLRVSNSQTALVCFVLVLTLYWVGNLKPFQENPLQFLVAFFVVVPSLWIAEQLFRVSDMVLAMLGRDRSLTNRTEIWEAVLNVDTDPLLGWGFYTFWDSETGRTLTEIIGAGNTHNGYIEVYLDGGLIGVGLLVLILLAGLINASREVLDQKHAGVMKFAFVVAAILYNWSESSFLRLSSIWFCFLFGALHVAHLHREIQSQAIPAQFLSDMADQYGKDVRSAYHNS
jgi:exopolysaccharide production protein ExoQ